MLNYKNESSANDGTQSEKSWCVYIYSDGGRLFQMSGPQTANARRPNSVRVRRMTAALVDAERRDACLFSTIPAPTLFTANLIV